MNQPSIKRTGLDPPHHPLQLTSWLLTLLNTCLLCILILPTAQPAFACTFGLVYASTTFFTVKFGLALTRSDPTDSTVEGEDTVFCSLCQRLVHRTAKHCVRCNRCVPHFDHHCKWINNCVGGKNYRIFIVLILNVFDASFILFTHSVQLADVDFVKFGGECSLKVIETLVPVDRR